MRTVDDKALGAFPRAGHTQNRSLLGGALEGASGLDPSMAGLEGASGCAFQGRGKPIDNNTSQA